MKTKSNYYDFKYRVGALLVFWVLMTSMVVFSWWFYGVVGP